MSAGKGAQTVYPSGLGSSAFRHLNIAPPSFSHSIPRRSRYHLRSLCGSFALKKIPPIPVTRFKLWCFLIEEDEQLAWRRRPGYWSWIPSRAWTHHENGSLAFSAAFRRHTIERSVSENYVVDRFSAIVVVIFLPGEAIKTLVAAAIGIDRENRAQVIVAPLAVVP